MVVAWWRVRIVSRPATDEEIPTGAKRVMAGAGGGWRCRATYARGQVTPTSPEVDSVVLRFRDGERCAVGAWEAGKFRCAYLWLPGVAGSRERLSAAALKRLVSE